MRNINPMNSVEIGNIRISSETESMKKLVKIAEKLYMKHRKKIEEDHAYSGMFG